MDAARSPNAAYPAVIWNFRYGRYNDGRSFADRVASGGLDALNPPAWAAALSEDDFPEVIGISKARSKETGLQWTRKWYQWGHANYDDFIISETVVENTSASAADGVYVVFQNRFWNTNAGGWRGGLAARNRPQDWSSDDHARSAMAANYQDGVSREAFLAGEGKPAGLPLGEDAMFRHFQRAIDAYDWGYDLPNEPPGVKLSWESNLDGQAEVRWASLGEASVDPDYEGQEAADLRGYRIYRSEVQGQGPWEFVTEFSLADARSGKLPPGVRFDPNGVFRTMTSLMPESMGEIQAGTLLVIK